MDTTNKYFLPITVLLAGALIAGAVLWNGAHPSVPAGEQAPEVDIKDVQITSEPFIGDAKAPVTIAFWSDPQCPYCKNFEMETLPQIIKEYVDTGKAKVVFFDFNFLGPDSQTAGVYARSVWKLYPEKYFAWRTAYYEKQDSENGGFGDRKSIDALTKTIAGLDVDVIGDDIKANGAAYQAATDASRAEGAKFGVQATPSFIIGTQLIQGAYPFATFKAAIETAN